MQKLILKIVSPIFLLVWLPVIAAESALQFSDLNWLTGVWRANVGTAQIEEVYFPAKNGEIVGTFTTTSGGKVTRYEMRSIRIDAGQIVFQGVAFGSGLQAATPLPIRKVISVNASRITFDDGLVIEKTGENTMKVTLKMTTPLVRTVTLDFTRALMFAQL